MEAKSKKVKKCFTYNWSCKICITLVNTAAPWICSYNHICTVDVQNTIFQLSSLYFTTLLHTPFLTTVILPLHKLDNSSGFLTAAIYGNAHVHSLLQDVKCLNCFQGTCAILWNLGYFMKDRYCSSYGEYQINLYKVTYLDGTLF